MLTVRDIATTLGVTEPTVCKWIKSGELPAIELAGRTGYRIAESDLEAFIQGRRRKAGESRSADPRPGQD